MPHLIEPQCHGLRGTFRASYALPKESRHVGSTRHRLGDLCRAVAPSNDPQYMEPPADGEFCVVDVVTKEKAWFEMPYGCTPEVVTGMVESHFDSAAFQVGPKMWFV